MDDKYRIPTLNSTGLPYDQWANLPSLLGGNQGLYQQNACIGDQYDDRSAAIAYVDGYRKSAELIAIHVEATQMHQDTLVYPFAYSWRHHFELLLKILAKELLDLLDRQQPDIHGHKLVKIWYVLRPLIEETKLIDCKETLDSCEDLLSQFDTVDNSGEVFRYELGRKGDRNLTKQTLLNIHDFNLNAASLSDCLSNGLHTLLSRED